MVSLFGKVLKVLPFLGAALILAAVGLALRKGQMDQGALFLIGAGFVCLLVMFLKIEPASLRYYLNLSIVSSLTLGILTLVYLIAGNHPARWDLTRDARYSLSPQTRFVIENLTKPVEIEIKATANEPWRTYLGLYAALSDRLTVRITNPYKENLIERGGAEMKINDIWVRSGQGESLREKKLLPFNADATLEEIGPKLENQILAGVLSVVQDGATRVYTVVSHGEKTPEPPAGDQGDQHSMRDFCENLHRHAIDVRILDLRADRLVPDDCSLLLLAGPQTDYSPAEIEALRAYLDRGGALLALIDPPVAARARLPRLRGLLAEYGVDVSEDLVADVGSHSAQHNEFVPVIHRFNPIHPATENMQGVGEDMALTAVCAVEKGEDALDGMHYMELIYSSQKSFPVTLEQSRKMILKEKTDLPPDTQWRKYSLALAAWPKDATGASAVRRPRIVVMGDSDFLTNAQRGNPQVNLGYFIVNWLVGQAVAEPPRVIDETPLFLTAPQQNLISILLVVVLPFSVFCGGLAYTTIRRRKR